MTGNTVTENDDYGIFLDYSSGNRLTCNTVNGHSQSGFVLFDSGGCSISGNTATGNGDYGLWAIESGIALDRQELVLREQRRGPEALGRVLPRLIPSLHTPSFSGTAAHDRRET